MPASVLNVNKDSVVRINLGILGTLLAGGIGCTIYLNNLNGNVRDLSETMAAVKLAIDRNTAQQISDGKALAILQTMMASTESRLQKLESEKAR